jgi:hypothetical protein
VSKAIPGAQTAKGFRRTLLRAEQRYPHFSKNMLFLKRKPVENIL